MTGSLTRATRVAAFGGQTIGFVMMGLGALGVLVGYFLGGLLLAFVGWFVHSTATDAKRETALEHKLRGVTVSEVMDVDHSPDSVGIRRRAQLLFEQGRSFAARL